MGGREAADLIDAHFSEVLGLRVIWHLQTPEVVFLLTFSTALFGGSHPEGSRVAMILASSAARFGPCEHEIFRLVL